MLRRLVRQLILGLVVVAAVAGDGTALSDQDGSLVFVGRYTWSMPDPAFGGFSGLALTDDGSRILALSDRAQLFDGRIRREDGRIAGIDGGSFHRLHNARGARLSGKNVNSEGLALFSDGTLAVSFEGNARVALYASPDAKARELPRVRAFAAMDINTSLEAVAVGPDGAVYTLPEMPAPDATAFPVFRFRNGAWDQPFTLPRSGPFQAVDADFGPDGRFYLLERDLPGFLGFRSRIRVFDLGPDGFTGGEVLLDTRSGTYDNLEGLSVWADASGAIRLTMISDDNFSFLQSTEIVEYLLQ